MPSAISFFDWQVLIGSNRGISVVVELWTLLGGCCGIVTTIGWLLWYNALVLVGPKPTTPMIEK